MKRTEMTLAHSETAVTKVIHDPNKPYFTPAQAALRWSWHVESVRRVIRERRMASVVISRRRLIPAAEIERVEREGFISRAQ